MPTNEVIIRLVRQDDAAQLRENIYSANTLAEVEERVTSKIEAYDRRTRVHLVAEVGGAVVATGGLRCNDCGPRLSWSDARGPGDAAGARRRNGGPFLLSR